MLTVLEYLKMGCWTTITSFHVKIILLDKQELIQEVQVLISSHTTLTTLGDSLPDILSSLVLSFDLSVKLYLQTDERREECFSKDSICPIR